MKYSTYYFRMKTKILASFHICISVPLNYWRPLFKERLYVLKNVTDSLASEYHFLPYFQTAVEMEKNDRKFPG